MEVYEKLKQELLKGSGEDVKMLTQEALRDGISAADILQKGLILAVKK